MTGDVIVIDTATSVHVGLTVLPTTSDCQSDGYLQSRTYITYCNNLRKIYGVNSSPPFRPVVSG